MKAETELERANRGKAFWQQFCLAGWQLMGWTDDVTATLIDGAGRCLEMRPGHVELIRQARRDTREEVAQLLEASEAEPDLYTRERRKELAATVRAMKEDYDGLG